MVDSFLAASERSRNRSKSGGTSMNKKKKRKNKTAVHFYEPPDVIKINHEDL